MTQTGDAPPGDARFFAQTGPHSLGTVATVAGGEASGDRGRMLSGVAPLGAAGPEHVSYLDNPRYADALARTRFGAPQVVWAPGIADLVCDTDQVVDGFFSMSFAAPHLFGDRRDAVEAELRALLADRSPDGRFWDWPGATEILIARKPAG